MKQTVCSAQIYECTEICDILNNAVNDVAGLDSFKELSRSFCLAGNKNLTTIADDPSSARIELRNNEFDFLILILIEISLIDIRYKAGRNEYSRILDKDCETALKDL